MSRLNTAARERQRRYEQLPTLTVDELAQCIRSAQGYIYKSPEGDWNGKRLGDYTPSEFCRALEQVCDPAEVFKSGFRKVRAWHVAEVKGVSEYSDPELGTRSREWAYDVALTAQGEIVRVNFGGEHHDRLVMDRSVTWEPRGESLRPVPKFLRTPILTGKQKIDAWREEFFREK